MGKLINRIPGSRLLISASLAMSTSVLKALPGKLDIKRHSPSIVTIQNGWNNRISYGCVYAQIRSGLGMHLGTYSNHDTVLFLLIVPIKGRFV